MQVRFVRSVLVSLSLAAACSRDLSGTLYETEGGGVAKRIADQRVFLVPADTQTMQRLATYCDSIRPLVIEADSMREKARGLAAQMQAEIGMTDRYWKLRREFAAIPATYNDLVNADDATPVSDALSIANVLTGVDGGFAFRKVTARNYFVVARGKWMHVPRSDLESPINFSLGKGFQGCFARYGYGQRR